MQLIKKSWGFLCGHKIKIIVLVAIIGGGFYYYQKNNKENDAESKTKVRTVKVEKQDIELSVSGSGQVKADSQVDLRPQIAGDGLDVVKVEVKNDQEVKKDDIIAVLDTEDALELIRDRKLELESSKIKQKQVNDESYRKTEEDKWKRQIQEIEIKQKLNKLVDVSSQLDDYYIRAPFDGIVTGLDAEVGDSVARDEVLASVITKELVANISLNEIDAVKVKKGAVTKLTFSALDGIEIEGVVSKIDTIGEVSQGVVSYSAEISFDASEVSDLKPGMSVEAEILIASQKDVLAVSVSAVQSSPKGDFVIVVPENLSSEELMQKIVGQRASKQRGLPEGFRRVVVKTGISDDVIIEIEGEIENGEVVLAQSISSVEGSVTSVKKSGDNGNKSIIPTMGGGRMGGGRK